MAVTYAFAIQTHLSVHGAAYLITLTYFTTLFTVLFSQHYPMWGPQVNDLIRWVRSDVRCSAPPSAVSVSPKSRVDEKLNFSSAPLSTSFIFVSRETLVEENTRSGTPTSTGLVRTVNMYLFSGLCFCLIVVGSQCLPCDTYLAIKSGASYQSRASRSK